MHVTLVALGVVGIATYSWAIPALSVLGVGFAVIAYRFPPPAGENPHSTEDRPDLPERFDDGQS
jgi:hypothetical protein